jgi:hypothetical protein
MALFRGIIDFIIEMKTLVIELSGRIVEEGLFQIVVEFSLIKNKISKGETV